MLDEDLEGDAIEEELAPVTLQLALVASRLGRHGEAATAYQVVLQLAGPACLMRCKRSCRLPEVALFPGT